MFIKFDFIRYSFLAIYLIFLSLLLLSPNEAFAMEPSDLWTTNYYGDKEYIGPDPYKYFHPDPAQSTPNIHELDSNPLYELDGKPIYNSINPSYDRDELHLWTPGQSITKNPYSNPVRYHFEPKGTTFELDADSYQGSISTNVDSVTWHRRNHNNMEIIRDYCTYVDNFSMSKKNLLTKISLCVETTKDNITFLYLKFSGMGKRKIIWTVWERNRSKYDSYKEFKNSWDSNSSVWSSIKKDIREDIRKEVEDLLGIRKIKKDIRKSVRSEVENLLRESRPFGK